MSEWLPIETAPKDGTQFLVVNDRGIFVVSWDKDGPDNCLDDFWHVWSGKFWMDLRGMEPTHWMPLPDRPPLRR
jgi:hypothetical protein